MNRAWSFFPKSLDLDSPQASCPSRGHPSHTVFPPSVSSAGEGRSADMTRRNPGRTALLLCQAETGGQRSGTVLGEKPGPCQPFIVRAGLEHLCLAVADVISGCSAQLAC